VTAMTLGELLGTGAGAHASASIRDLVLDSRAVQPGAAFVALRGASDHGLRHAPDALARRAEVVLYDPAELGGDTLAEPAAELAGITGTNGKTTVAYLVAQAMGRAGARCGYVGTLGHGLPDALEPHALTTPDCFTLHRELAALAAQGGSHAALEVSSHALVQERIAGLEMRTGAFTNLTRDHLDAHGSLEAYGAAKARLFERAELPRAVVNVGDPFGARLVGRLADTVTPIRVAAADDKSLDIAARVRSLGVAGIELELDGRLGSARMRSP